MSSYTQDTQTFNLGFENSTRQTATCALHEGSCCRFTPSWQFRRNIDGLKWTYQSASALPQHVAKPAEHIWIQALEMRVEVFKDNK